MSSLYFVSLVNMLLLFAVATASASIADFPEVLKQALREHNIQASKDWKRRISEWDRVVINTTSGPIIGAGDDNVTVFLGVPFAAPPVNELRWAPPMPHSIWAAPRHTTWWGPACPQSKGDEYWGLDAGMSEDCLYLNVYVPSKYFERAPSPQNDRKVGSLLPIQFWIYGGCYSMGSADIIYSGANDIVHGGGDTGLPIIYVTINYRVGVMGFLGGRTIREYANPTGDGSTGTWGVQDQRRALAWVKANAKFFGGDPERITIYGESAGGGSVSLFLTSPQTWHLFDKAIIESGPGMANWVTQSIDSADRHFDEVVSRVGCPLTGNESIECLRGKSWKEFQNLGSSGQKNGLRDSFIVTCGAAPTVDNVTIIDPHVAIAAGQLAPVPVITGTNRNETTVFNGYPHINFTNAEYLAALEKRYSWRGTNVTSLIYSTYPPSRYGNDPWQALSAVGGDREMTCPNRELARALVSTSKQRSRVRRARNPTSSNVSANTYVYLYDHENWLIKQLRPWLGVFHMTELINVWDMRFLLWAKGEKRLAQYFIHMWSSFSHTGSPNQQDLAQFERYHWDAFTQDDGDETDSSSFVSSGNDTTFEIFTDAAHGPYGINTRSLRKDRCDMWLKIGYNP